MPPAKFNPYDPPLAELPAQPKATKRAVSFGEVVIVAWIFTALVLIMVPTPATRASLRHHPKLEQIVRKQRENVLMFLALTVSPVLTVAYVVTRLVKSARKGGLTQRTVGQNR